MTSNLPTGSQQRVSDWRAFASRFDLDGMRAVLNESACPFDAEDEKFSARALLDAVQAGDLSGDTPLHTLWHCLGCGACTPGAQSPRVSFAALVLQARRLVVAQGEPKPELFRGAFASLGRLADASGGLRPRRLLGEQVPVWPHGETVFWTGRMGLAAALLDAAQAARVQSALVRSFHALERAGLKPAVLDPEPILDFESAWWGDRDTFLRRADLVGSLFKRLDVSRVVTADPISSLLVQWAVEERGLDVSVESFVERWRQMLAGQSIANQSTADQPRADQPRVGFQRARSVAGGEPLAVLPGPLVNLSFLATEPVLDSWSPPSLDDLVWALGYEPKVLFAEEARSQPGMASVGLRSLALVSARSAALCRRLLREADRVHARKVLVSDPMAWAALMDVSRTGTWRQALAGPVLPGELVPLDGREG